MHVYTDRCLMEGRSAPTLVGIARRCFQCSDMSLHPDEKVNLPEETSLNGPVAEVVMSDGRLVLFAIAQLTLWAAHVSRALIVSLTPGRRCTRTSIRTSSHPKGLWHF